MTSPTDDTSEIVLRPPALSRVVGWALTVFGVIFGVSGFVDPADSETLAVMLFAGVVLTGSGLALASSRARVSPQGIRYRNGLHRVHVPATDIDAFGLGPGSGFGPKRVAYVVSRRGRQPLRLIGIQQWDSAGAWATMAGEASQVTALLGLDPSGE